MYFYIITTTVTIIYSSITHYFLGNATTKHSTHS